MKNIIKVFSVSLIISSLLWGQANERKVICLNQWYNKEITLQCEVIEKDSSEFKIKELNIYKETLNNENKIFSYRTLDRPIAIFPIGLNLDILLTIWETGSAYHIEAFSFNGEKIVNVLDAGSKYFPELFYEDQNSEEMNVIVTNTGWIKDNKGNSSLGPITAIQYHWKNGKYVVAKKTPWLKRLSPIKSN